MVKSDLKNRARILHTSDWQMGMTRKFLKDADEQTRFDASRIKAVRKIRELAEEMSCDAVVVAGDLFDDGSIDAESKTYRKTVKLLCSFPCPVYILPGNHDPLTSDTVYRYPDFSLQRSADGKWEQCAPEARTNDVLHVITSPTEKFVVPNREGSGGALEIWGSPLLSNTSFQDPLKPLLEARRAEAAEQDDKRAIRVALGHGAVSSFGGSGDAVIDVPAAVEACQARLFDYVALGDTHSARPCDRDIQGGDNDTRVWYSGAPETTDFRFEDGRGEVNSGKALIVDIEVDLVQPDKPAQVQVTEKTVGAWDFLAIEWNFSADEDVKEFVQWLDSIPEPDNTVVKYYLRGSLTSAGKSALLQEIEEASYHIAALYESGRSPGVLRRLSEDEVAEYASVSPMVGNVVAELSSQAQGEGHQYDEAAMDILIKLLSRENSAQ